MARLQTGTSLANKRSAFGLRIQGLPRGSTYTTIRELGPKIPYYRRNYGSQFPYGCICGPSGLVRIQGYGSGFRVSVAHGVLL